MPVFVIGPWVIPTQLGTGVAAGVKVAVMVGVDDGGGVSVIVGVLLGVKLNAGVRVAVGVVVADAVLVGVKVGDGVFVGVLAIKVIGGEVT